MARCRSGGERGGRRRRRRRRQVKSSLEIAQFVLQTANFNELHSVQDFAAEAILL